MRAECLRVSRFAKGDLVELRSDEAGVPAGTRGTVLMTERFAVVVLFERDVPVILAVRPASLSSVVLPLRRGARDGGPE